MRLRVEASSLLGYPDSNQEKQDQNLLCYHYTISQFYSSKFRTNTPCSELRCKGTAFFFIQPNFSVFFFTETMFFSFCSTNDTIND